MEKSAKGYEPAVCAGPSQIADSFGQRKPPRRALSSTVTVTVTVQKIQNKTSQAQELSPTIRGPSAPPTPLFPERMKNRVQHIVPLSRQARRACRNTSHRFARTIGRLAPAQAGQPARLRVAYAMIKAVLDALKTDRPKRTQLQGPTPHARYGAIVVLVNVAELADTRAWLRVNRRSPSPEITNWRSRTCSATLYSCAEIVAPVLGFTAHTSGQL